MICAPKESHDPEQECEQQRTPPGTPARDHDFERIRILRPVTHGLWPASSSVPAWRVLNPRRFAAVPHRVRATTEGADVLVQDPFAGGIRLLDR
jgi:hypothetical protein